MIPLLINAKHLCQIFEPELNIDGWTEDQIREYSLSKQMYPTDVKLTAETYSRDAERTADYELEYLNIVNRKAKPEFTWALLRADYAENLMALLEYHYDFKDADGVITPIEAPRFSITYRDFIGMRTITSYVGQTIEGTLVEYEDVQYWQDFRIAFPEF
jgi:hypothetical protein